MAWEKRERENLSGADEMIQEEDRARKDKMIILVIVEDYRRG